MSEAIEALKEYIREAFRLAREAKYISDPAEAAVSLALAREVERRYGVSLLREIVELQIELTRYTRAPRPLVLEALEAAGRGLERQRITTNVLQSVRRRRVEEEEPWG